MDGQAAIERGRGSVRAMKVRTRLVASENEIEPLVLSATECTKGADGPDDGGGMRRHDSQRLDLP